MDFKNRTRILKSKSFMLALALNGSHEVVDLAKPSEIQCAINYLKAFFNGRVTILHSVHKVNLLLQLRKTLWYNSRNRLITLF